MATIKYWNGSAWELAIVGKQGPVGPTGPTGPAGQASLQRFRYVATGGQTSVSGTDANGNTLAYTPGLEEVFINGAAQVRGQDYTATNGTSITGITALIAGDVVEIYAWGVFNVANTISNTLIDAKGDILAGTGADSVGRLAVGANNTVLTADSSTATGLKWAAPAGGGKVLQVVFGSTSTTADSSSATFADTNLSATITPTSATSKILVVFNQNGCGKYSDATYILMRLLRDSTTVYNIERKAGDTNNTASNFIGSISGSYLDEPATTSAITYKTQFAAFGSLTGVRVQGGANSINSTSTMVLMEIGA